MIGRGLAFDIGEEAKPLFNSLSFLRISAVEHYLCLTGSHGFLRRQLVDET